MSLTWTLPASWPVLASPVPSPSSVQTTQMVWMHDGAGWNFVMDCVGPQSFRVLQVTAFNAELCNNISKYNVVHLSPPLECTILVTTLISLHLPPQVSAIWCISGVCWQDDSVPWPAVKQRVYLLYTTFQINQMTACNNVIWKDWKASQESGTPEVRSLKEACSVPTLLPSSTRRSCAWQWCHGHLSNFFFFFFLPSKLMHFAVNLQKRLSIWKCEGQKISDG